MIASSDVQDSRIYKASPVRMSCWGMAWLTLGAMGALLFSPMLETIGTLPLKDAAEVIVLPLMALGAGLWHIVAAIRGLPHLKLTPERVELETLPGTWWARWQSIGDFTNEKGYAVAPIVGKDAKVNLLSGRNFVIPPSFLGGVKPLIAELNARRAAALRETPPASARAA